MGYAAAPRVAFIVYGIQTFFTAIIITNINNDKLSVLNSLIRECIDHLA